MDVYNKALEIKDEIISNRRNIHGIAEVGMETVETANYVIEKLEDMGYSPKRIAGNGVTATVGNGGKTMLLRADMDALPMREETGLEFASTNGNSHSCGHDTHTAMLLGAARILKDYESELKGTVKFMFQPGEELLIGAKEMIDDGILENPKVDAAMMCHVNSLQDKGVYLNSGAMTTASYNFRLTVKGKGCHGAMPETGVDPVIASSHIIIGLQEILSREVSFTKGGVLTTGHISGGSAPNIIPNEVTIEGTMRTFDNETYEYVQGRIKEISSKIAEAYRCSVDIESLSSVPVVINDEKLVSDVKRYIKDIAGDDFNVYDAERGTGSEDFALISAEVPSCMLRLAIPDESGDTKYPLHHSKVILNEDGFPIGSAVLAGCAIKWLEENN